MSNRQKRKANMMKVLGEMEHIPRKHRRAANRLKSAIKSYEAGGDPKAFTKPGRLNYW